MTRRRVDHVILYVEDLEASVYFYRHVVGLQPKLRTDTYAEFITDGTKFGLFARAALPSLLGPEATAGGPEGEALFLVEDVDVEAERVRRSGVHILSGPVDRPWGHRTMHVLDPDGHVVEFAQEIPRADR